VEPDGGETIQPDDTTPPAEQPPEEGEPAPEQPVYVDPYAEALAAMDFAALREVNSDVLGWILIPGTKVSYPLVQGEDNDFYLNHTWKKSRSAVGSIFLESRCSSDLMDPHTIIYGHRMKNGSMFASLGNYKNQSYWSEHPSIYITTDSGSYRYDIFAAYEADVTGHTYTLEAADWRAFVEESLAQSVIDTGILPVVGEPIITLSTCTGDGYDTRWVVQAVMRFE